MWTVSSGPLRAQPKSSIIPSALDFFFSKKQRYADINLCIVNRPDAEDEDTEQKIINEGTVI